MWGNFLALDQRTYLFFEFHPHMIPPKGSILTCCKRRAARMSMMKSLFLRAHWWLDQSKPIQTLITLNECKNTFHWIPCTTYAAIDSFSCKNNTTWNTLNLISLVRNKQHRKMHYEIKLYLEEKLNKRKRIDQPYREHI